MRYANRRLGIVLVALTAVFVGHPDGSAGSSGDPRPGGALASMTSRDDGVRLEGQRIDPGGAAQGSSPRAASGPQPRTRTLVQTVVTPGCPGNNPNITGRPSDGACQHLVATCNDPGDVPGSIIWIWQRPANGDGPWQHVGSRCAHDGADTPPPAAPVITPAMVQRAFRDLPFAQPRTHVQPEGNITLVNLPTYYQVRWPTTGYQPDETAAVTLLGLTLQIRPTLTSYTYDFGDGTRHGPTTDPGGTYPHGRIRHTYRDTAAAEPVRTTATYSGQYRLPGGTWQDIGITVPITGPTTTVIVKQARNRLIDGTS